MPKVVNKERCKKLDNGDSSCTSKTQLSSPNLTTNTLTDQLVTLFDCCVCFEIILPPIMQCQVGHLLCSSCRNKLSCCPMCRGSLDNIRNLAMENVANSVTFPCKHKEVGCIALSLGLNEKKKHEEICEFHPYSCPVPDGFCNWKGQLDEVMRHVQCQHNTITIVSGETVGFSSQGIYLPDTKFWRMIQSCLGRHFMLVVKKVEDSSGGSQFFAIVLLIGSRKDAEEFSYRFELKAHRRCLTWEATTWSIREKATSATKGSDCFIIDHSIAQQFADNGNLDIRVTISLVR